MSAGRRAPAVAFALGAVGLVAWVALAPPRGGGAAASGGPASAVRADFAPVAAGVRDRLAPHEPGALSTAEDELARARAAEQLARSAAGRQKLAARLAVADCWRAAALHHPHHPEATVAATRAAAVLLALELTDEARAELERAVALAAPHEEHLARLQLGHLERRAGRAAAALDAYAHVERDAHAPRRARDEAALWAGRVHAERGARDAARRLWQWVAERGEDRGDRVLAGDWLALAALAEGDVAGARAELARTAERVGDVSQERTPEGARVRRALARMRVRVELALAADDGPPSLATLLDEGDGDASDDVARD